MPQILSTTDFTGKYAIAQGTFGLALTDYIERYEKQYLTELFGVALYDLFIAALTANNPPAAPYAVIFDALNYEDGQGSRVYQSLGIEEMLKAFIYFEMARDQGVRNTGDGNVEPETENSRQANGMKILRAYNDAIDSYKAIQYYILLHADDYPDYNGQYKEHINLVV